MIRLSSNTVAANAAAGAPIGVLSVFGENETEYPAIFMIADDAVAAISENRLFYSGRSNPGKYSISVSAMFVVRRQIAAPHIGISIAMPVDDPTGAGAAAVSHGLIDDPTGAYAIAGGLLVPRMAMLTIETPFTASAVFEVIVTEDRAAAQRSKK